LIPERENINTTTRIIMSFVISIIIDAALGLILNFTSAGITLNTSIISIYIFTLVCAVIGIFRQLALPKAKRTTIEFQLQLMNHVSGALNTVLIVVMAFVVVGALGAVTYFSLSPKSTKPFTQFYIVNQGSELYTAANAPDNAVSITLGIKNNENSQVDYHVQALINNVVYKEINTISLSNGQSWQESVALPASEKARTEIEFQLFKNNDTTPYLEPLRVWIDPVIAGIVSP